MECQTTKAHIYKQSFSLKKKGRVGGRGDNTHKNNKLFFLEFSNPKNGKEKN
jgi:hypothetical protein